MLSQKRVWILLSFTISVRNYSIKGQGLHISIFSTLHYCLVLHLDVWCLILKKILNSLFNFIFYFQFLCLSSKIIWIIIFILNWPRGCSMRILTCSGCIQNIAGATTTKLTHSWPEGHNVPGKIQEFLLLLGHDCAL